MSLRFLQEISVWPCCVNTDSVHAALCKVETANNTNIVKKMVVP